MWSDSVVGTILGTDLGVSFYPSGNALSGFFLGGGFHVSYWLFRWYDLSDYENITWTDNTTVVIGAMIMTGHRWMWDFVSITPSVGLRLSRTINHTGPGFPDLLGYTDLQPLLRLDFGFAF